VSTAPIVTPNQLKAKFAANDPSFILSVRLARTVDIIAMAASTGHDAIYIDLQHASMSLETASQMCMAGLATGVTPLVRVPSHDAGTIGRVLDGGAQGIIAPDVRTASEAEALARCCHFPPRGIRSVCVPDPHTGFRTVPTREQSKQLDAETLLIAMIEAPEGVDAADAIAAVDGVDALFVGTYDLTSAMGIPGELDHPRVREAYRVMIAACKRRGKSLLVGGIKEPAALAAYVAAGAARCYFTGSDTGFMLDGARRQVAALRAADPSLRG
jgi:2-keto-3-deoxy-L-rhamnonate aldolase RhmA